MTVSLPVQRSPRCRRASLGPRDCQGLESRVLVSVRYSVRYLPYPVPGSSHQHSRLAMLRRTGQASFHQVVGNLESPDAHAPSRSPSSCMHNSTRSVFVLPLWDSGDADLRIAIRGRAPGQDLSLSTAVPFRAGPHHLSPWRRARNFPRAWPTRAVPAAMAPWLHGTSGSRRPIRPGKRRVRRRLMMASSIRAPLLSGWTEVARTLPARLLKASVLRLCLVLSLICPRSTPLTTRHHAPFVSSRGPRDRGSGVRRSQPQAAARREW